MNATSQDTYEKDLKKCIDMTIIDITVAISLMSGQVTNLINRYKVKEHEKTLTGLEEMKVIQKQISEIWSTLYEEDGDDLDDDYGWDDDGWEYVD